MINYAHRGASAYAAQNTLSAFYLGIACGANGIETDIRLTADGVPVLFHDRDVDRSTDGTGMVKEMTFDELRALTVQGSLVSDKVATLDEFFTHFGWRDLHLALELKCKGVAPTVADYVRRWDAGHRTYITSASFGLLEEMRACAPELRLGYLAKEITPEIDAQLEALHVEQLCPKATLVTPQLVADYHARGYSVRAWGVDSVELMAHCVEAGVDGMTINFPDKLAAYLAAREGKAE